MVEDRDAGAPLQEGEEGGAGVDADAGFHAHGAGFAAGAGEGPGEGRAQQGEADPVVVGQVIRGLGRAFAGQVVGGGDGDLVEAAEADGAQGRVPQFAEADRQIDAFFHQIENPVAGVQLEL